LPIFFKKSSLSLVNIVCLISSALMALCWSLILFLRFPAVYRFCSRSMENCFGADRPFQSGGRSFIFSEDQKLSSDKEMLGLEKAFVFNNSASSCLMACFW